MFEELQRAWFTLGFIVFIISWIWQGQRMPHQTKIRRGLTALVLSVAAVKVFLIIIAKLK